MQDLKQSHMTYVSTPFSYIDQLMSIQFISLLQNIFEKGSFTIHNIIFLILILSFDGMRKWIMIGFEQFNLSSNFSIVYNKIKNRKLLYKKQMIEEEQKKLKIDIPYVSMEFKPAMSFWESVFTNSKSYGMTNVSYNKTCDKSLIQDNVYEYKLKETYTNINFINDKFEAYFNLPINVTKSVVNGYVKLDKIEVAQKYSNLLLNANIDNVKSFSDLLPFPHFAKQFKFLIEKREYNNIESARKLYSTYMKSNKINDYINFLKTSITATFYVNAVVGASIPKVICYSGTINLPYSSQLMDLYIDMIPQLCKKYPNWDIVFSLFELYYICSIVNDKLFHLDKNKKVFTNKVRKLFGCDITKTLEKFNLSITVINSLVYSGKDIRDIVLKTILDANEVKSFLESQFFPELCPLQNASDYDPDKNIINLYGDMNAWISYVQDVTSLTISSINNSNTNNESQIYILKLIDENILENTPNPAFEEWEVYVDTLKNTTTNSSVQSCMQIPPPPPKTLSTNKIVTKVVTEHVNNVYKDMSNLYLRKEDKQRLLKCLLQFKENKKLLKELGIPNKLGIMLYGEPGTGKSSTIHAIASFLKKNIYYIQLNEIKTNTQLRMLFNHVTKNCTDGGIIVMEDIDAMTHMVHKRECTVSYDSVKNDKSNISSELTLDFFLNILQGSLTSDESIFITTTNHLHKLDPAFYRDGRFDIKIEMKAADHYQINNIYERFFSKSIPQSILKTIPEYTFTPATLISKFREYLLEPDIDDKIILKSFINKQISEN